MKKKVNKDEKEHLKLINELKTCVFALRNITKVARIMATKTPTKGNVKKVNKLMSDAKKALKKK